MYKHILIPTDGSDLATSGLDKSLTFAASLDARVTILTVTEPFHVFSTGANQLESSRASYESHMTDVAKKYLNDARAKADRLGVTCDTVHRESDIPFEAIISTAHDRGCDLIAMASHGRAGVAAVLLGSQTLKVLTHSKVPVLVYR